MLLGKYYLLALSTYLPACIALPFSPAGLKTVSGWPEASPEVLKDCINAISLYLLDNLPEPFVKSRMDSSSCLIYNCMQRANVPLLSY